MPADVERDVPMRTAGDIDEAGDLTSTRSAGLGSRALRNTAWIMAVRVLSRLVALVTVVVMGNALGATGLGQMQTAITYSLIISVVADIGFSTLYVREGARHPERISEFLNNMLSVKVPLMAIASLGVLGSLWAIGLNALVLPAVALLITSGYQLMLRNTLYALQRLGPEIAEIIPEALLLLGFTLVGAHRHAGAGFYLWAYCASYIAACVYFAVVLYRMRVWKPRWRLDLAELIPWFKVGIPFAVTYIFTTVYFKIDVPILQHFRPYDEVGWYTFAYKPFEALLFIPLTVRSIVFPVITVYHHEASPRVWTATSKFFKALAMFGVPVGVGTVLLAPQLNSLMHLYPQSEVALAILGLAIPFMFADNTFAATLNAIDRQGTYAKIAISALVINVGLNLFMIPAFGYRGAAWSVVLTEVLLVSIGFVTLWRLGYRIPVWHLSWRVFVAGGALGAMLWLINPHGLVPVVAVICAGAVVYGGVLFAIGGLDEEDRGLIRRAIKR